MQLTDFQFLLTSHGQQALAETAVAPITPDNHLQIAGRLRKQLTATQAHAVLETTLLRQQATIKFSQASEMYFTRPALEQASGELIATYRAQRFFAAGFTQIADLGCSIGSDALAMAAQAWVLGIDLDPVRLAMARENLRLYGRHHNFQPLCADLRDLTPPHTEALFFDPARRDGNGRRLYSVHRYKPPLTLLDGWRGQIPHAAAKISPGVDYAELPSAAEADIEFISLNGEVKEGVLWYGDLRRGNGRCATLLPAAHALCEGDCPGQPVAITQPQAILYEPDGAVIRAHLVQPLARLLNATQIDRDIAYLTAPQHQPTPFARGFAIEAVFPFQLKRLRHYLREQQIGQVTIKKRGSPLDPDVLRRQLRLQGHKKCHIFLTQVLGEPTVLIGQPIK